MKSEWYDLNAQMICRTKTDSVWQSSIYEVSWKLLQSTGKIAALTLAILVLQSGGFYCVANEIDFRLGYFFINFL